MRRLSRPVPLIALLVASCSLAPPYKAPKVEAIPAAYKEAGPWQLAHPSETLPRGPWWSAYHDAQLDHLESQIDAHNPNVAEAVANYDVARADVAEARSPLFPQITTEGSMTTNRQSDRRPLRSPNQPTLYPANTVDAEISYDLDLWGRLRNALAAQKEVAQASAGDLETIRLSLHAELANDYMALRGLDAQDNLLAQTEKAYQRAVNITQSRYSGKIASGIDVARAEDQLQTAQAQRSDIAAQRALFEHAIASLVGTPASAFSIAPRVIQIAVPEIPTGVPSALLQRRPDIAAAERRVAAANSLVGVARAAFYPDISLRALFGFQDTGQTALISAPYSFWSLGPQFALPLFEGGLRRAQEAAANATVRAAGEAYRAVVLTSFQQVEDSLSNLRILARELRQEQAAVAAAQRVERMALSLYRDGATNYLDVVVAQTAELEAEQTVLALQTRILQSSVQLVRALGGGWSTQDLPTGKMVAESTPDRIAEWWRARITSADVRVGRNTSFAHALVGKLWHCPVRAVSRLGACDGNPEPTICYWSEPMLRRDTGAMDLKTAASITMILLLGYAAWLTSIVFCASNGMRPLLIAGAAFFPVAVVHGIGIWFGGW